MRERIGYCSTGAFKVPSVIRGLEPDGGGGGGISFPVSITFIQATFIGIFFAISLPLIPVVRMLPFMGDIATFVVFNLMAPIFIGYLVGERQTQHMNMLQYWLVRIQRYLEPARIFQFEEVEPVRYATYSHSIRAVRGSNVAKETEGNHETGK